MTRFTLVCVLALAGCGDDGSGTDAGRPDAGSVDGGGADAGRPDAGAEPDAGSPAAFEITSTAYGEGDTIPTMYECGPPLAMGPGGNVSPPLAWTPGPPGTMSYALVMRDLDSGVVHWVVYDLPPTVLSLPEGIPGGYEHMRLMGGRQAELQGSGYFGYFGPCSPGVVNTYQIAVHAIPTAMLEGVTRGSTEVQAAAAVEAASIASASLSGES